MPRKGCPYKELCHSFSWIRDRAAAETAESSHRAQAADRGRILSAALKIHDLAIARKERPGPTLPSKSTEPSQTWLDHQSEESRKGLAGSFPLPL